MLNSCVIKHIIMDLIYTKHASCSDEHYWKKDNLQFIETEMLMDSVSSVSQILFIKRTGSKDSLFINDTILVVLSVFNTLNGIGSLGL